MKYLDAKRRLLFISSTIKYIKLVMTNNKMITLDEVKLFVKESMPMVFGGEISTKDKVEIINTIISYLLKGEGKSYFKGSLNFNLKNFTSIDGDELTEFTDKVKPILANSNVAQIYEPTKFISLTSVKNDKISKPLNIKNSTLFNNITNLIDSSMLNFKINNDVKFLDSADFKNFASNWFKIYDTTKFKDIFEAKTVNSLWFTIDHKFEFKDSFTPAPKAFEYIDVNEPIIFNNEFNTKTQKAYSFDIYSETKFENDSFINLTEGTNIKAKAKLEFLSLIEFKASYGALCKITDKLLIKHKVKLSDIETFFIETNSKTQFPSKMTLEIGHLIIIPLRGKGLSKFMSELSFDFLNGSSMRGTEQTIFSDNSKLLDDKSDIINSNKQNMFSDYLKIGTYRYALLKEIENIDMTDYMNSTIDSIIYLEN